VYIPLEKEISKIIPPFMFLLPFHGKKSSACSTFVIA